MGQSQDHIPWLIVDDMQLVSLLPGVGGSGTKDMLTVADVMCRITRERGVTESKVVDHDLDAKKTAACQVLCRFCKLGAISLSMTIVLIEVWALQKTNSYFNTQLKTIMAVEPH